MHAPAAFFNFSVLLVILAAVLDILANLLLARSQGFHRRWIGFTALALVGQLRHSGHLAGRLALLQTAPQALRLRRYGPAYRGHAAPASGVNSPHQSAALASVSKLSFRPQSASGSPRAKVGFEYAPSALDSALL